MNEELARHQPGQQQSNGNSNGHAASANGSSGNSTNSKPVRRDNTRPATASQVRALNAIADRRRMDLALLLSERFQIQTANELSISEASDLIDELKQGHAGKKAAA